MFSVSDRTGAMPRVVLEDSTTGSRAEVAPSRGAICTSLFTRGREWLYLDEATLLDAKANVRGGIPVLFPGPGKLANDAWARAGKRGSMKQHGFGRNRVWRETSRGNGSAAELTLELRDDADTLAQFPWPFRSTLRFSLRASTLRIDIAVQNSGSEPLPFGYGFHPYFAVPQAEKGRARVPTKATRVWDNVQKKELPYSGIDFTAGEVDLHLRDHGTSAARLELPAGTIALAGSPEFTRWVVWSLPGKDFICLEPWTSPGDALNTGDGLLELAPGQARELWLEISAT
ncbi:MAG: galactose mutarotase [Deltaproteobacteria bacterium]|nr:galactose mutarotase [Deltaproteobacteria bacterium]